MPAAVQNLMSKVSGGASGPGSGSPPPTTPAGAGAGNSGSSLMDTLSGAFGGGNPLQQQNNTYVKGKVDEYMAQQNAIKARAQQKGAQAQMRELKKGQQTSPPPQMAQPGTGVTATTPLQQVWQSLQASLGMK